MDNYYQSVFEAVTPKYSFRAVLVSLKFTERQTFEFFLNAFTEFAEFSDKNIPFSKRTRTPAAQLPQRQHNTCDRQEL